MKLKNLLMIVCGILLLTCYSCQEEYEDVTSEFIATEADGSVAKRICLTEAHMQSLLQNNEYRLQREKRMASFKKFSAQHVFKANCSAPTVVPVAVHFQGINNSDDSCLRSLAIDQINRLNLDYKGENSDISSWTNQAANQFPGVSNGAMCVQFVIADQNHPSGYGLNNGDLAITINRTQGDQVNNWAGYINIFVQPNTGYLGYAPLGGAGNGDGVVIDAAAFGAGQGCGAVAPESPFNLGRTLTHEMGHYLLLDHIWGNGCSTDDEVGDTPDQASDYGGCPGLGASSCGSTDMHMNYMDYTDDVCMYMFSAGQESRMTNYLLANLTNITGNVYNVYSGGGGTGGGTGDQCLAPNELSVNSITEQSALVSWSARTGVTSYQVQYRKVGTSPFVTISATATSTSLDGLEMDTPYEVRVRTVCGQENSSYTALVSFATTGGSGGQGGDCTAPTSADVQIRNTTSVLVDWADITDAIRYQVRYRAVGSNSWTKKGGTKSQKVLNNLVAQTYEYQIRTKCPSGWTSWSTKWTFDLESGGGSGAFSIKIQVTLDDYGSETSWELYDNNNNLMSNGGPYQDGHNGTVKSKEVTLADGCYEIDLYDAFGDGICCEYGNGNFEVTDSNNQRLAYSNGNFGSYELIAFCVTNGRARITKREKDAKKSHRGTKSQKK